MTTSIARWAAQRRRTGATQQFIAFQLGREWFALPIQVAHRVVPLGPTYGDPAHQGISLTHYQDREILVLDIKRRIFGAGSMQLPAASAPDEPGGESSGASLNAGHRENAENQLRSAGPPLATPSPHILIVHTRSGELVGLQLESLPTLRRAARATIAPLPPTYLNAGLIRCISALVVPPRDEPPLFLLNLDELLPSLTPSPALPATLPSADA
ncbi:MAG: chemotaxis protein CheW [Synechococcales cyanobacterium M58_A2018_015]|nr:chemotaxis protein CheW [Synechococcales cyanobacterium M58_A2018_015]